MENIDTKIYELESYLPLRIIEMEEGIDSEKDEERKLFERNYLQKMLEEDIDEIILDNIRIEKKQEMIKRYQYIVNKLKQTYGCKCQICGQRFLMDNGTYYCEAHHIKPLSEDGKQDSENVILLCANHHRMFHYAKERIKVGELVGNKRVIYIDEKKYEVEFIRC